MTNIKYNLSKPTPPMMPRLGKGTECVQLLLSQVSKDMHQPLVPMLFSILGAHVSGAESCIPTKVGRKCAECWLISWLTVAQERAAKTLPNIMFQPWLKTNSEDRRNGLGGYGRERAWRLWRNKPVGYGEMT